MIEFNLIQTIIAFVMFIFIMLFFYILDIKIDKQKVDHIQMLFRAFFTGIAVYVLVGCWKISLIVLGVLIVLASIVFVLYLISKCIENAVQKSDLVLGKKEKKDGVK